MKVAIISENVPQALGTYSPAIKVNNMLYLSGQIALNPISMELYSDDVEQQIACIFKHLTTLCEDAGGSINNIVKLSVFLTNIADFAVVNTIMERTFNTPYPARTLLQVAALPRGAKVAMDAIVVLSPTES